MQFPFSFVMCMSTKKRLVLDSHVPDSVVCLEVVYIYQEEEVTLSHPNLIEYNFEF